MSDVAKIIKLSENNDYYVKVLVNGIILEAMISSAPYFIEEGKEYNVEFSFYNNDNVIIERSKNNEKKIEHNNFYSYFISGLLVFNNVIDVGITIMSDFLLGNDYLIGNYICVNIDRLEINFI